MQAGRQAEMAQDQGRKHLEKVENGEEGRKSEEVNR